ncbi:DNA-binding response regulator [Myxococcus sp. 1LA]
MVELEALSRADLVARVQISQREDPHYVPSECLLYFVRANRAGALDDSAEKLYKILLERVRRCLPKVENADGSGVSLSNDNVRDKVLFQFVEMLAADRETYSERLDFFEVRFDGALKNLKIDAQRQVLREGKRSVALEVDEETGELSVEIERAVGSFDRFYEIESASATYRLRLEAAIDDLPIEQRRVIEMLRKDFPIASKEAGAVTISGTLKKSEKTIRNYRDRAVAHLRAVLSKGDEP